MLNLYDWGNTRLFARRILYTTYGGRCLVYVDWNNEIQRRWK